MTSFIGLLFLVFLCLSWWLRHHPLGSLFLSPDESASASLSFSQSFTHRWSSKEGRDKFASESRHQSRLSCCQSSFFSGSFTWRMYTRRELRILPLFTFFYYTSFVFSVSLCSLISGFIPSVPWSFCQKKMPVSSTCCWVFRCLDAQVVVLWQDKFPDDVSWLSLSHWMKEKVKSRQVQSSQENPGFLGLWLLLLKFIPSLTLLWCHNPWSGLLHCQRIKKVIELLQNIRLETRIRISSLGIKDREDGLSSEDTFSVSLVSFMPILSLLLLCPSLKGRHWGQLLKLELNNMQFGSKKVFPFLNFEAHRKMSSLFFLSSSFFQKRRKWRRKEE